MSDTVKVNRNEVELSEELLTLFAKFLVPEIRKFYQSEEGKAYYEKWMKKHAEYAAYIPKKAIDDYIDCFPYI